MSRILQLNESIKQSRRRYQAGLTRAPEAARRIVEAVANYFGTDENHFEILAPDGNYGQPAFEDGQCHFTLAVHLEGSVTVRFPVVLFIGPADSSFIARFASEMSGYSLKDEREREEFSKHIYETIKSHFDSTVLSQLPTNPNELRYVAGNLARSVEHRSH